MFFFVFSDHVDDFISLFFCIHQIVFSFKKIISVNALHPVLPMSSHPGLKEYFDSPLFSEEHVCQGL